jgi:hypothetical protein
LSKHDVYHEYARDGGRRVRRLSGPRLATKGKIFMSEKYKAVQVDARAGRAELAPQLNGARSKEFIEITSERLTVGSGRAGAALSLDNGTEQRSGLTLLKRQSSGHPHRIPLFRADGELVPFSRLVQSSAKTSYRGLFNGIQDGDVQCLERGSFISSGSSNQKSRIRIFALTGSIWFS